MLPELTSMFSLEEWGNTFTSENTNDFSLFQILIIFLIFLVDPHFLQLPNQTQQ